MRSLSPTAVHPANSGRGSVAPWPGRIPRELFAASSGWREYLQVVAVIAAISVAGWFSPFDSYRAFGQVYLLAVVVLCLRVGPRPILFAAIVSALAWNYVLMPPRLSFSVLHFEDTLLLGTYFMVALTASQLIGRIRMQERAAESDRLARTLLDSVSHELKTPLAVLRSASEGLAVKDEAKRTLLAAEIRTATQRLDRLIGQLLDQTRLEAGAIQPKLEPCEVRDLLAAARKAVGEPLVGRSITLAIPAGMPLVRVDAVLIEHALSNILLNAALYTPGPTPIAVTAGCGEEPDFAFIAITDHGPGIPAGVRNHLFDKFRRGDEARPGGVGLGLSIVKGLVAAHGGAVRVEDTPGGGATFTVLLPCATHASVPDE